MTEVSIRLANEEDREPIRHFLRKFFFKDEPMNSALKLITEETPVNEDLENFTFQFYGRGFDLVAEYEGRLVGVCLNAIIERGGEQEDFSCSPGNKFGDVASVLAQVEAEVDFFTRYPNLDKYMNVCILSVDSSVRGKGIAKKLVEKTKQIAVENGAQMLVVECSSFYSAAVSKSLGFEQIYSKDYTEFKKDGKQIVKPADPHKAVTVFVSKL